MKRMLFLTYLAMIFASNTIGTTIFAQVQTLSSKEWRNDMVFLAKNLAKVHDDPFFQLTKKEYRKLFTKLYFTIPFKNHTDISIEMAKIVAKIGDERTWIDLTQDSLKFQAYPIELYWFDDGIFVINSTQEYSSIIGQRLVRKLCPNREKYELSRDEQTQLEKIVDPAVILKALKDGQIVSKEMTWAKVPFYKPSQSAECPEGYVGRKGIYEVLQMTQTIKDLVMANATGDAIEKQARSEGMLSMAEDGIFKAVQGITTIEEVLRVISE